RLEAEHGTAVRLALELGGATLPHVAAVRALTHAGVEDPLTLGALLRRRRPHRAVLRVAATHPHLVDGSVLGDYTGEVEEEAVGLARRGPHPPPDHLDVEDRALRRPKHPEKVGVWRVESGGENLDVHDAADPSGLVIVEDALPLGCGRIAGHYS